MTRPGNSSRFIPLFLTAVGLFVLAVIVIRVASYQAEDVTTVAGADGGEGLKIGGLTARPNATSPPVIADVGAETATIVETDAAAPAAAAAASRAEERRRLFDRLLTQRAGTVPQPAATPAPAPPVVTAPPRAVTRAALPAPTRPTATAPILGVFTQSGGPQPAPPQPPPNESGKPAESQNPDDPNSDSTPPQVDGIEFNPPQVRDGETTVLTIVASDNLTGVRSISGTIVSPTGSLQGFACQREPDSTRFSTRVAIPKDAAEGTWRVSYVSLSDNASNTAQVTYVPPNVPPGASFRVTSSRPDSSGPTLKAVWMERPAIRAGEKNVISVQADDDKAGVKSVSGIFVSPAKHARIGFNCQQAGGLDWRCTFTSPACIDCGTWQLEQVQLQDQANNTTTHRGDNPLVAAVKMDIFGDNCDATPPVMQTITLDRNSVSNAVASSINVTVVASDNLCGVGSVSGHATGPSRPGSVSRIYFALNPAGDALTWTGPMNVPEKAPKGIWTVTWVQVLDKGYNLKAYSQGEMILGTATFRVE